LAERLKEIFVIKPTEKLQKYTWDDARYFIHEGKLKEKPLSSEEHPSSSVLTQVTEETAQKQALKKTQKEAVIDRIYEVIEN
jgi:50S ribosomal subunit-associated GTPase HflX